MCEFKSVDDYLEHDRDCFYCYLESKSWFCWHSGRWLDDGSFRVICKDVVLGSCECLCDICAETRDMVTDSEYKKEFEEWVKRS